MLYERWLETVHEFGDQPALDDRIQRRRWTFDDLAEELQQIPAGDREEIRFPQGRDAAFILQLLSAWRDRQVVCPIETSEEPPEIPGGLPPGIVHLKQTSGTTAAKRFVMFTAAQLGADVDNIVATMSLSRNSPNLGVISLAHSYGFSSLILPLLFHGIPLTLVESPLPEALRAAAATGDNWTLPAVPALWQTWLEADAVPRNVHLAISAGAPLPLALESAALQRTGIKIHNFLGSSECGGIAFDRTDTCRLEAGSAGTAMERVRVEIGNTGCIEVRGPAVGTGYWPEEHESLQHGRFTTQDLAEIHGDTLVLQGRVSDVINVSGRKVSPEKIEQVLLTHPAVAACVVFGVPANSSAKNEDIIACLKWSDAADIPGLRELALRSLQAWETPGTFVSTPDLEANVRGKISRRNFRDRYLRGEL